MMLSYYVWAAYSISAVFLVGMVVWVMSEAWR